MVHFVIGFYLHGSADRFRKDNFMRHITSYAEYLARDIGAPPDLERARLAAEKSALKIMIHGPGLRWSSDGAFPDFGPPRHVRRTDRGGLGFHRGRFVFFTEKDGYRFTFHTREPSHLGRDDAAFYIMLGALTLVLAGAYLLIRRIMRPVKLLEEGIREAGRGNLDYRVPVISSDELGNLSRSFNEMNGKIGEMIESRERLLLDVSHELRSPLTRMRVALEFLPEGQARTGIGEDIAALNAMITEILETERLRRGGGLKKERLDLAALVGETVSAFPAGRINVTVADSPSLIIEGDRERLKMVIRNLLENAIKYSDSSSSPVEMHLTREKEDAVIRVRDHGPGIPKGDIDRVFEPFYRSDPSRSRETGGYGLGLHLCRRIVEAHGGTIELESEEGKGACFVVRLNCWLKPRMNTN